MNWYAFNFLYHSFQFFSGFGGAITDSLCSNVSEYFQLDVPSTYLYLLHTGRKKTLGNFLAYFMHLLGLQP